MPAQKYRGDLVPRQGQTPSIESSKEYANLLLLKFAVEGSVNLKAQCQ